MKKYIYIIAAVLVAGIIGLTCWQAYQLRSARAERDRYHRNSDALLGEVEHYRIRDSISVARAEGLELTLKEYQRFRADDAALVASLRSRIRDLENVVTSQSVSGYEMAAPVHDTIIIRDSVPVQARAVRCGDAWYEFEGVVTLEDFEGRMTCRDSIIVAESIQYRRFLGFLWRTKRIKSRTIEVLNKNPHSTVEGAEIITIKH